jgi:M6 family metalloprotease domain protein
VSADGRLDHDTQNSDPFPTDLNNSLTKSTDPRLSFYTNYNVSPQAGLKQIVRNNDNTISFHFTPLKAATGINNLSADHEQSADTYTLSGMKVVDNQNLHNQIVIVKGKKVRK